MVAPNVATWASFGARAVPLVALPILITNEYDESTVALWMVLITLQGLQLLFESNIGLTFIRAIGFALGGAEHVGLHNAGHVEGNTGINKELLAQILKAMQFAYAVIAVLSFMVLLLACAVAAEGLIHGLTNASDGVLGSVIFVICCGLRVFGGLHISYLYGIGKITELRWIEFVCWCVSFAAAAVVIFFNGSFATIVFAYQAPLVINLWVNYKVAQSSEIAVHEYVNVSSGWPVLKELWPVLWRSSFGAILYLGVIQGSGLLYARFGEPETVAYYLFALSLMRPMMQFAQVPFFTQLPKIAMMQVSGQRNDLIAVAQKSVSLSLFILSFLIAVAVIVFAFADQVGFSIIPVPQPASGEGRRQGCQPASRSRFGP